MTEAEERAYQDGIDHAVKQVNEELERVGSRVRFVNAGLATVCMVDVNSSEGQRATQ
jgi:hypothetical protein